MSFASYTSTRTSETSGEIGSSHDPEAFADGFKEWLVNRVEGWARENHEEAQRVERVIGQAQSVFLGAIREAAPVRILGLQHARVHTPWNGLGANPSSVATM